MNYLERKNLGHSDWAKFSLMWLNNNKDCKICTKISGDERGSAKSEHGINSEQKCFQFQPASIQPQNMK